MSINSITALSQLTSTAVASYGNLSGQTTAALKLSLTTGKDNPNFTSAQADTFIAQYDLLNQLPNVPYNGFSASVFLDKTTGKHVIAMRGTEVPVFPSQTWQDLVVADGLSIGGNGFANGQAVEMIRYYKRLTTAGGASVQYTEKEKWQLFAVKNSLLVPLVPLVPLLSDSLATAFAAFKQELSADKGITPPAGSATASVLSPTERVDVTGHSLGGHLAVLFARFFPENVDQVVTLNAPGLFPQGDLALTAFGYPPPDNSRITRIEAEGDGISKIGTVWNGSVIRIAQENDPGLIAAISSNHSSVNGNDALALMSLIGKLDLRYANDAAAVSPILQGASNVPSTTYENTLDGIRRLLLGSDVAVTETSSGASDPKRSALYDNMNALSKSSAFKAIAGKVQVTSVAGVDLVSRARTDFSDLLSLVTLNPVLLTGTNAANNATLNDALQGAWGSVYGSWQADNLAIAAGRTAENYTDSWIADRSAMLGWLVTRNQLDLGDVISAGPGVQGMHFKDVAYNIDFNLGPANSAIAKRQTLFGGVGADPLSGQSLADRLYGGEGADTLSGLGGADYLEGNTGDDALDGGDGNDTLLGGMGADWLKGGDDNDSLLGGAGDDLLNGGAGYDDLAGGAGDDVYVFDAGWGFDSVVDSDGKGSILVTGLGVVTGAGATKVAEGAWRSADKKTFFTLVPNGAANDLVISFSGAQDGSKGGITVRGWVNDQLGITLPGTVGAPVSTTTYVGDFIKKTEPGQPTTYVRDTDGNYVSDGVQADAQDVITGSANADSMLGLGGNDALAGMAGDDFIDGGAGDDLLMGGLGADTLLGGAGHDFIYAGGVGGLSYPTSTAAPGPRAPGPELTRGFSWVTYQASAGTYVVLGGNALSVTGDSGNVVDGGGGDDTLLGAGGADVIHGGDDKDFLEGLGGNDVLFGDAGDDALTGDGTVIVGMYDTTMAPQHGNDILVGGSGNDFIVGGGGDDELYGGTDNDTLYGDALNLDFGPLAVHGNDYLDGGDGQDELYGGGQDDTLFGGLGNDTLLGDDRVDLVPGQYHGMDYLDGEAGNDLLEGGGKGDTLFGGEGNDTLWGDASSAGLSNADNGADYLDGEAGNDLMAGGGGADSLFGGEGDDELQGDGPLASEADGGDDYLDGEAGNDSLYGNAGNDMLIGGEGDDQLSGGAGNDTLNGGAGTDALAGGAGDDTYVFNTGDGPITAGGFSEAIDDNEGRNTVILNGVDVSELLVRTDGRGQLVLDMSATDRLVVVGGVAGAGNRYQLGGQLGGQPTPSTTTNASSKRSMSEAQAGVASLPAVDLASDGDTQAGTVYAYNELVGQFATGSMVGTDALGHEHQLGGRSNDSLTATTAFATLSGGRGNDTLTGSGGNNSYLYAKGDGADVVIDTSRKTDARGAAAPNQIVFGAGIRVSDLRLFGAAGQLTVQVGANANDRITLGSFDQTGSAPAPIDFFVFADGSRVSYAQLVARGFDGSEGNDTIDGTMGNDRIDGRGGDDILSGGLGKDTISGGAGNDMLAGGEGDDFLEGGAGRDALFGGAGNDTLVSDGNDYLDGGEGDDIYRIAGTTGDTVVNYNDAVGKNTVYIAGANTASSQVFVQNGSWYLTTGGGGLVGLGSNALLAGMVLKADENDMGFLAQSIVDRTSAIGLVRSGRWNPTTRSVGLTRDVLSAQTINGTSRAEWLEGGAGADAVAGGSGDDVIDGGAGADVVAGGAGADTIRGGRGTDTLWAANASDLNDLEQDVFVFARGDGADYLRSAALPDGAAKDVIRFEAGISRSDISVSAVLSTDEPDALPRLTISYGGSDRITLEIGAEATIAGLQFADGTSMSMAELSALLPPAPGGGSQATEADDLLIGTAGVDHLYGRGGNDTLIGGFGDDVLEGGTGRNVYRFSSTSGHDLIAATQGEQATLMFADVDPAAATVRLEGGNLVVRTGNGASVQIVGFTSLPDAAKTWRIQFGSSEAMSIATLLNAAPGATPSDFTDRRERFLAQQRTELVTLPQRVFNYAAAVPRSVSEARLTADSSGYLALPNYLSEGAQTLSRTQRSRQPVYEVITPVSTDPLSAARFVSIWDLNGVTYNSATAAPVYGPNPANPGQSTLIGYYVVPPAGGGGTGPQYRIVGYTDVVTTITTQLAADSAVQLHADGSDGNDYFNARVNGSPTEFRGSIDTGAGDDSIYLSSVAVDFNYNYGGIYARTLNPREDWAPIKQFASIPFTYMYRERGLGAWIDAGDGNDSVMGTDAADIIVGGRGSDTMNGQAGADTYLIGRGNGSVDAIEDTAVFRPDNPHDTYFLYGGEASNFHQDTVEFESDVDRSRMSYRWLPNSGNELELYLDGELFLQISYDNDGSAGSAGAAGIERFVFGNGEVFSLAQLRAALPQITTEPPVSPRLLQPIADVAVDEDTTQLNIDLSAAFVDPRGEQLTYQLLTTSGSQLPAWLKFDAATGRLTGQPGNDDVGVLSLLANATNASGLMVSDRFDITVINVNDAPQAVSPPKGVITIDEGKTASWLVDWFRDVDVGDTLALSMSGKTPSALPSWVHFDPTTRLLTADPPDGSREKFTVRLTATDRDGAAATTDLTIRVQESLIAPTLPPATDDILMSDALFQDAPLWNTGDAQLSASVHGLVNAMAQFARPDGMMNTGRVDRQQALAVSSLLYQDLYAPV